MGVRDREGPAKRLEYEWRLEKLFHERAELNGICQYRFGTLLPKMIRHSLLSHASIFISAKKSLINPHYMEPKSFLYEATANARLDSSSIASANRKRLEQRQTFRSIDQARTRSPRHRADRLKPTLFGYPFISRHRVDPVDHLNRLHRL